MDVNPERFNVRELVTSACDTGSPLIQEGVELRQDVPADRLDDHCLAESERPPDLTDLRIIERWAGQLSWRVGSGRGVRLQSACR